MIELSYKASIVKRISRPRSCSLCSPTTTVVCHFSHIVGPPGLLDIIGLSELRSKEKQSYSLSLSLFPSRCPWVQVICLSHYLVLLSHSSTSSSQCRPVGSHFLPVYHSPLLTRRGHGSIVCPLACVTGFPNLVPLSAVYPAPLPTPIIAPPPHVWSGGSETDNSRYLYMMI